MYRGVPGPPRAVACAELCLGQWKSLSASVRAACAGSDRPHDIQSCKLLHSKSRVVSSQSKEYALPVDEL